MIKINLNSKRNKAVSEELQAQITTWLNLAESEREKQHEDYIAAWKYKLRQLPETRICPSFVAPVVHIATESMKESLLDVFTSDERQAIAYRPQTETIVSLVNGELKQFPANMIADAVDKQINDDFIRNQKFNGYRVLEEIIDETVLTGGSWAKWHIEEEYIRQCLDIDDWMPIESLAPIIQQFPDTNPKDLAKLEHRTITHSVELDDEAKKEVELSTDMEAPDKVEKSITQVKGKLNLLKIIRHRRVDTPNFQDVVVDPDATCVEDARYLCHRQTFTVGELLDMGFKEADVLSAIDANDEYNLDLADIVNTNEVREDNEVIYSVDEKQQKKYLFEHFVYSSLLSRDGTTKLLRVITLGNEPLEAYEVDEIPFSYGNVLPVRGSLRGDGIYKLFKQYQDLETSIANDARLLSNYTANPAYMVAGMPKADDNNSFLQGGAVNMRDLSQLAPGSLVRVNDMNAVSLVPGMEQLNIATQETVRNQIVSSREELLKSSSSEQLDNSVLSNTTAAAISMVMGQQGLSDRKFAGNLARTCIIGIAKGLYKMLREEGVDLTLSNGDVFNSSQLPSDPDFIIDVQTKHDEALISGMLVNIANIESGLSQSQSSIIGDQERYNIYSRELKGIGISDPQTYLKNPEDVPPPSPEQIAEMQKRKELEERTLEATTKTAENTANLTEAQVYKEIAQTAKYESETVENINQIQSEIKRGEEKSVREFEQQRSDKQKEFEESQKAMSEIAKNFADANAKNVEAEMELKFNKNSDEYTNVIVGR